MDRLKSMEIFVAIVERGSLSGAARRHDITGPMAGKHLRALEQRLGVRLVHRTTRRHTLTEAGRRYFERCKQLLRDIEDTEHGVAGAQSEVRGELRVAAPVTFGAKALAPAIAEFLARHREVSVELVLDDDGWDPIAAGFDVAVRIGTLADSSLIARPIAPYHVVIAASPAYLKRRGTPRTPADLADHDTLGFTHWDKGGGWALGRRGIAARIQKPRLRANVGDALRAAAVRGAGLIMQPEVLLADDLAAGRLVPVMREHLRPARPMQLVYARDRQAPPKLTKFVEFMLERFGRRSRPA